MKEHLDLIAKSYDEGIDLGKKGIDSYENLPPHITNHPYYPLFEQTRMVPVKRLSSILPQKPV